MTPGEAGPARSAGSAGSAAIEVGAIAFDLDGTLLDTVHELATALNALLDELGYPPLAKDVVGDLIGKGMANLVRRSLALATGVSPEAVDDAELKDALGRYQAHYASRLGHETRLFPGMVEGLRRLEAMGIPLAVITNKATRFVRPHLVAAGIEPFFSVVIGGDDLPTKKPHPGPLQHVAAEFGIPPPAADGRRFRQRRRGGARRRLPGAGGPLRLPRGAAGAGPRGRWYSSIGGRGRRSRPLRRPRPTMSFDLFSRQAAAATARWRRAPCRAAAGADHPSHRRRAPRCPAQSSDCPVVRPEEISAAS